MELKTLTLNGKTYDSFPFNITEADKQEIAELAAEMVEIPAGGGGGAVAPELLYAVTAENVVEEILQEYLNSN